MLDVAQPTNIPSNTAIPVMSSQSSSSGQPHSRSHSHSHPHSDSYSHSHSHSHTHSHSHSSSSFPPEDSHGSQPIAGPSNASSPSRSTRTPTPSVGFATPLVRKVSKRRSSIGRASGSGAAQASTGDGPADEGVGTRSKSTDSRSSDTGRPTSPRSTSGHPIEGEDCRDSRQGQSMETDREKGGNDEDNGPAPPPRESGSRVEASPQIPGGNAPSGPSIQTPSSRKSTTDSASPREKDSATHRHPHMDLAKFPTSELLKLLASLLHQIASANDALRPPKPSSQPGESSNQQQEDHNMVREEAGRPKSAVRSQTDETVGSSATVTEEPARMDEDTGDDSQKAEASRPTDSATTATPTSSTSARPSLRTSTSSSIRDRDRDTITTAARHSLSHPSAILCFHARNVPSISIEAYLQRILKYCPVTNEVFLSLLVYFDRMSRNHIGSSVSTSTTGVPLDSPKPEAGGLSSSSANTGDEPPFEASRSRAAPMPGLRGFAIDSFNVHRLIIAGITVASKFFSDVFYTNSRYAKVGGLPLTELNQLELQFLLLNDFHLVIPLEELQRYADQLLVYWQREKKADRTTSAPERSKAEKSARQGSVDPSRTATSNADQARDSQQTQQEDQPMPDA